LIISAIYLTLRDALLQLLFPRSAFWGVLNSTELVITENKILRDGLVLIPRAALLRTILKGQFVLSDEAPPSDC